MAGVVVYYSNYGSTRQYAEWIAEETGFILHDQRTGDVQWDRFDTVVVGSPVLKMRPFLAKWMIGNWLSLEDKRVFLFSTSGASATDPGLRSGFEQSFPPEMAAKIEYVPFQGRMTFGELKPMHRMMMRIGKMIEKNPERKRKMLEDVDGVDRSAITPLVSRLAEK